MNLHPSNPPSQKIKGLLSLAAYGPIRRGTEILPLKAYFPVTTPPLQEELYGFPYFCRPCPISPQHGFVESRICKSYSDLIALIEETKKIEPEAWIMVTPVIPAKWNAIWTPSSLTVGPGHDGATSGKDCIFLPLAGRSSLSSACLANGGIGKDDHPYIEAVGAPFSTAVITQLRAGPPIDSSSPDFIPGSIEVKEVISPKGEDLLEWQKRVKTLSTGTVVYHPGGSIADHYSVHCRMSGIPIVITFEPQVGSIITGAAAAYPDPDQVREGALLADFLPLRPPDAHEKGDCFSTDALCLLLLALHNAASLHGPASFWLGAAATLTLRLGSTGLRGEARHETSLSSHKPFFFTKKNAQSRSEIWARCINLPLSHHRSSVGRLENVFRYGQWSGPGFGGLKWAACAESLVPLFNALRETMIDPSQGATNRLVIALNVAVHQVHNGGWWLNKFGDGHLLSWVQEGNPFSIIQACQAIWAISQKRKSITPEMIQKKWDQWKKWPALSFHPFPAKKAFLVNEGGTGVTLKIVTRIGSRERLIPIPSSIRDALKQRGEGSLFVLPGPNGYRVEFREFNLFSPPLTVWEESPLNLVIPKGLE